MSEVRRRKFDKEFKLEAVRLVVEEGRPVAEVASSSRSCKEPWYT
jgi:transposase-like protein